MTIRRMRETDNGPKSVAEHGGPVPFQWLDADRRPVPTGTGTVDCGYLGVCSMVMSYAVGICGNSREKYEPNELDVGWEVLDAATARESEVCGYGAWAEHSAWGVDVERILGAIPTSRNDITHHDWLQASADAFGTARFDELMSAIDEDLHPLRVPSLTYGITVVDNDFADASGVLSGGFFGPAHDEMAGTIDDPQRNLLAGFGGVQRAQTADPLP